MQQEENQHEILNKWDDLLAAVKSSKDKALETQLKMTWIDLETCIRAINLTTQIY